MTKKIVIEANIPFIRGVFEPMADVVYLNPEQITPEAMVDADALITRTRTTVDSSLLSGSKCSIVASATIGLDHVDKEWCDSHGVMVANAPGCNAPAVAQYVLSSLLHLFPGGLSGKTIGVVGVGHVGSIVARWAEDLGMRVMMCDPPRAEREGTKGFCTIDEIAAGADVITFHTPLTGSGDCPTFHLCSKEFVGRLTKQPVIINSARGGVVDTEAVIDGLQSGNISRAVIDCWENEPDISRRLLDMASIATPHIAGYSREGKIRATRMAVEAVCSRFGFPNPQWDEPVAAGAAENVTAEAVIASYDPMVDTLRLKAAPEAFEQLRNKYALRPEVKNYKFR